MGRKFKFSAQDRDLEYCKNPAVSSDKKPPLCHMTYDSIHSFYERFLLVLYLLTINATLIIKHYLSN